MVLVSVGVQLVLVLVVLVVVGCVGAGAGAIVRLCGVMTLQRSWCEGSVVAKDLHVKGVFEKGMKGIASTKDIF